MERTRRGEYAFSVGNETIDFTLYEDGEVVLRVYSGEAVGESISMPVHVFATWLTQVGALVPETWGLGNGR